MPMSNFRWSTRNGLAMYSWTKFSSDPLLRSMSVKKKNQDKIRFYYNTKNSARRTQSRIWSCTQLPRLGSIYSNNIQLAISCYRNQSYIVQTSALITGSKRFFHSSGLEQTLSLTKIKRLMLYLLELWCVFLCDCCSFPPTISRDGF